VTDDRVPAIEALLLETQAAHGEFETNELNGVYDREWPRWYAQYAVDHEIGKIVGRDVTVDELALFLTNSWDDAQRADPKPTEPWAAYTARRIAAEL
jgi:hypothetical protein